MTAMTAATANNRLRRARGAALTLAAICAALAAGGCGTSHPKPILASELAEAQTFPYYRVYWVGPSFDGQPLAAADGLRTYIDSIGDSVYYGDCVQSKGIFGGGSCALPLQVTTVIYKLHSNASLGTQSNMLVRGVPATVYDEGRSIEIYTGRVAIDIFSDTYAHALQASGELRPAERARLLLRRPAGARLLPRAVRAAERQPGARHGAPAPPRLPADRRPAGLHQADQRLTGGAHRLGTAGATGLPISRRRLRNASEPITAGTHSEIAR